MHVVKNRMFWDPIVTTEVELVDELSRNSAAARYTSEAQLLMGVFEAAENAWISRRRVAVDVWLG